MLIAFISDIHANFEALKTILERIDDLEIKKIYCLGDIVGYGPDPNECIENIRGRKIPSILGNHECGVIEKNTSWFNIYAAQSIWWTIENLTEKNLNFIKTLPEKVELTLNNRRILLVHGSPNNPTWEYVYENNVDAGFVEKLNYDIIVMGHTHIPFIKKVKNKLVINPGSIGQSRDGDFRASFAIVDLKKLEAKIIRVEYDVEKVARKIIKAGLPEFLAIRLYGGI